MKLEIAWDRHPKLQITLQQTKPKPKLNLQSVKLFSLNHLGMWNFHQIGA